MNILCTILMRAGSKAIKNKNFIKINNQPLFHYTINQAIKSNLFLKIVVSTDSDIIISKLKKYNIDLIIKREKKLSKDNTSKVEVIKNTFNKSEKFFKTKFDYICDLDVTSPLRNIDDIKKAFRKIKNNTNANNLVTVCEANKNPYFNMLEKKKKNYIISKIQKKELYSRQSAPKVYDMNASIYFWKRKALLDNSNLINNKTIIYEMPKERSIDIDDEFDLKLVRLLI